MKRITVEISEEMYKYLSDQKKEKGSSIAFEANLLLELAVKERLRKKKNV